MTHVRTGSILVIVVGFASVILALTLSMLVRMRRDAEDSNLIVAEAQARIMLNAALMYVQEGARIGWTRNRNWSVPFSDPSYPRPPADHDEAFGWTDVRGGSGDDAIGPRGPRASDGSLPWLGERMPDGTPDKTRWPWPGTSVRCPMYVMEIPPGAVLPTLAPNPITVASADYGKTFRQMATETYGKPEQAITWNNRDPLPVGPIMTSADTAAARLGYFTTWNAGNPAPRVESLNLAWFRVYRETEADHDGDGDPAYDYAGGPKLTGHHGVFVITCGAGGTQGFRDWNDVVSGLGSVSAATERFGSADAFAEIRRHERLLWYRAEWSAAIGYNMQGVYGGGTNGSGLHGIIRQGDSKNQCGSIRWIERLDVEPPQW